MKDQPRSAVLALLCLLAASLTLMGCPREEVDLCSGATPHPDCPGGSSDMGTQDVDTSTPDDGATPDMTTDADVGALPCGGACVDPTPVCDADNDTCVECLLPADCASGVCTDDHRCVECNTSDDCTGGVCSPDNTCVECVSNDNCESPTASLCDTASNTCSPCAALSDCGHLAETTVCDSGECVACTGTEYGACNGVCDSRLRTCTDLPAADLGLCEACVSDAQCRPGMLCVPMTFEASDNSGPAEVGTFCLWERDSAEPSAPNGACSTVRPYIDATEYTSLDGATATMCGLRVSTCPGLKAFDQACATAGVHDDCGAAGFDDALCVMFDAAANLCTTFCAGDNDCKPGFACDTAVTPNRCEL